MNNHTKNKQIHFMILLTHRHSDHSGELRSFPNARVYARCKQSKAKFNKS